MKKKRAQQSDWQNQPIPKEHVVLSFQHEFSLKDYERLQQGVIPEQMEDKWFIYFEDNKLFCHRSWTGNCHYVVEFEVSEKNSQIVKVTVNRDKTQYKETDDKWDSEFVVYLINLMLLGKDTPYPEKKGVNAETSVLQQWSQVGRAMLGDDTEES